MIEPDERGCEECGEGVIDCEVCERPDCEHPVCFTCSRVAAKVIATQPHTHGG